MTSDVFLDTNVLAYSVDAKASGKRDLAQEALQKLVSADLDAISTQVLQEFYVTATGKLGVAPQAAKEAVRSLACFQVVTVTPSLIGQAIDLHIVAKLSFWDAFIVVCAQSAGCDELWTEDLQDGRQFDGLRVVNPFVGVT